MTHDPLCLLGERIRDLPAEDCARCRFIAKVRSDTLDSAAQRVEENALIGMTLTPKEVRMVIAAIRGGS